MQGKIVGQRPLHVAGERNIDLITNQESILPLIGYIIACTGALIGAALSMKKKEPLYFLLLLMVGLLIIALLSPWWSLQGSSTDIQTSSTLYLIPLNLVSITETPEVIGGDLSFFPDIFITIMMFIPILTIIVSFLVVSVLCVKKVQKKQFSILVLGGASIILFISLVLFVGAMSAFAEVGVGSFIGNSSLDIAIQGQEGRTPVLCQWGPGIGFWLYMMSGVLLIVTLIIHLFQKKKKNTSLL
jgi:predicted neutral ceramidase superfamily lipid hydrolase